MNSNIERFPEGTEIELHGLASVPQYNGQRGVILSYDEDIGRYTVELESSKDTLNVKPTNVIQIRSTPSRSSTTNTNVERLPEGTEVEIHGLKSVPQYNGERGVILSFAEDQGRYTVELDHSKDTINVAPKNVIVATKTRGLDAGIQPQLSKSNMNTPATASTTTTTRTFTTRSTRSTMPSSTKGKVVDLSANTNGQIFGTSKYILPNSAGMVAEAKFGSDCRLCPCGCCPTCPNCCPDMFVCVSDEMVKRKYARVYENRIEINNAWTYIAYCCLCACSNKQCVSDSIEMYYFDMPPSTAWSAPCPFCCLPCTCCGRPAVAVYTPKCCGCKCESCGQTVFYGPCALKSCICCGPSCFPCSTPILFSVNNGDQFLSAWKAAYESYAQNRGIPRAEQAKFFSVTDGCCGFNTRDIPSHWDPSKSQGVVEMQVMQR